MPLLAVFPRYEQIVVQTLPELPNALRHVLQERLPQRCRPARSAKFLGAAVSAAVMAGVWAGALAQAAVPKVAREQEV